MSMQTAFQITVHLRTVAQGSDSAHAHDLNQFADMLRKAHSSAMAQNSPTVSIGIVSHGAQWLMYAVQNAASEDEPAERNEAREVVFTALKDALARVTQPS